MKCLDYDKGFFRDGTGLSCWSYHVFYCGVPMFLERVTNKLKFHEEYIQVLGN